MSDAAEKEIERLKANIKLLKDREDRLRTTVKAILKTAAEEIDNAFCRDDPRLTCMKCNSTYSEEFDSWGTCDDCYFE